jgi:tetratricopeptide (TPR) repeat protein
MGHLDEETILHFTLGTLSDEAAQSCEQHFASCPDCRQRQKNISSIVFAQTAAGSERRQDGSREFAPLTRGTTVGHYLILDKLGEGGMGDVFSAFDPRLDRRIALKLLRGGAVSAEEGKARLLREAQAMARLQHPNVIAVHDVGTFGDRVFLAMEFVEGETLSAYLRAPRTYLEVLEVFAGAGRGLAAAHAAGLVHRDFKPDNVLIGQDGRPRVVDFGLARQSSQLTPPPSASAEPSIGDFSLSTPLTRDGAVMGTPAYMAPEQLSGLPIDARTDQFSFCVALYEALFRQRPFGGATLRAQAAEIALGRLAPAPNTSPVPTTVFAALARGLQNDPNKRWPDMAALLAALEPRRRSGQGRLVGLIVALSIIALTAGGLALWQQRRLRICGGAERRLTGIWDEDRKKALKSAFVASQIQGATEVWRKVERLLDAWALEWVNTSRDACESARVRKTDSDEAYEMRLACLDSRLERLRAQTNLFAAADIDIVESAPSAAASLEPAAYCLTSRALNKPRVDRAEREASLELEQVVVEAKALFDASKYAEGIRRLAPAISPAASDLAQAEALLLLEFLQRRAGLDAQANTSLLGASEHALRANNPTAIATAFSRMAVAHAEEDLGRGDMWARLAHAAAAKVVDDWEVLVELARNDGLVATFHQNHEEARRHFERVLSLQEQHLGPHHPEVAHTYNLLGVALTNENRHDEAIAFFEKSLALHLELEGPLHSQTASAQTNLAASLRRRGQYQRALELFQSALDTRRAVLGAEHLDTLKTMEGTARTLQHVGRHRESIEILEALVEIRRRVLGPFSKEVAATCALLSELYTMEERWLESRAAAEEQLSIALQTKGDDDALTARARLSLANALVGLGQWPEAKKNLDEAMRILRAASGDTSLEVAIVLQAQGRLWLAQRRPTEAKAAFEQALTLLTAASGATKESMASSKTGIGRSLLMLEQPKDAVIFFEEALTLLRDVDDRRRFARAQLDLAQAFWADAQTRAQSMALLRECGPHLSPNDQLAFRSLYERAGLALDAGL